MCGLETVRPITAAELVCCNLESLIAGPADDNIEAFPFESTVVFKCDAAAFECVATSLDCVGVDFTCDAAGFGGDTAGLSCGGVDFSGGATDFDGDATDFNGTGTLVGTLMEVVLAGRETLGCESEEVVSSIRDGREGELAAVDTDWAAPTDCT